MYLLILFHLVTFDSFSSNRRASSDRCRCSSQPGNCPFERWDLRSVLRFDPLSIEEMFDYIYTVLWFSLITRKHSSGMRTTRLPKVPVLVAEGRYLERGILPLWDTYPLDTSTHRIPAPSWKPTSRIRTPLDTYPLGYLIPMSTHLMPTPWCLPLGHLLNTPRISTPQEETWDQ